MNRLRLSTFAAILLAIGAPALAGDDAQDTMAAFFQRLQATKTPFDEFRFLAGAEVQANPTWKQLAAQTLAASQATMGRPNEAYRTFPYHDRSPAPEGLPTPASHRAVPAVDWVAAQAKALRVVMVNESHHQPRTRLLTLALLAPLRAQGYTHLAVETLAPNPLPKGYPTLDTGYYTRDPVFAELIREAIRLGYVLVPYEPESGPDQTQQQRETGMAQVLADLIRAQPDAKLLVHAGYGHIGKDAASQPGQADPMAREFMRLSGLPVLALDQTKMGWEDGEAQARLARAFALRVPSVLLARDADAAWSTLPTRHDASIVLPDDDRQALRPDWLTLDGRRQPVAIDFSPCKGHLPCLAEARHAAEGDDAIPADQFVLLADTEAGTPLFLAPGGYRLRYTGGDGNTLAERRLQVPSAPDATTTSAATP
ncbi:MAG: hypothetical protein J0L59_01085 [Xanthomonadales bacterium]|nr:hypothetical protein [Xanthomonadales bacterium]